MRIASVVLVFFVSVGLSGQQQSLIFEGKSKYSHIKVKDQGRLRSMYFVRDSGQEVIETTIDKRAPHLMRMQYIAYMMSSYLFNPEQKSCLIVGLGGGAMVHFMNRHFQGLQIDAIDIDPLVVKIAKKYFFVKNSGQNRVFTADGFVFLRQGSKVYDTIYMDAYLKPSEATDSHGMPLNVKTLSFLKHLQTRVKKNGLIIINMNLNSNLKNDLRLLSQAFAQIYMFQEPELGNLIVVASKNSKRLTLKELKARAQKFDASYRLPFSFKQVIANRKTLADFN